MGRSNNLRQVDRRSYPSWGMEQEIAFRLQTDGIHYQTQIEIPVTTADFYFATEPKPLIVFVDGRVHLGTAQMIKDEELRSLLRKRGYRVLELYYDSYSDKKRNQLYEQIQDSLRKQSLQSRVPNQAAA